MASKKEKKTKDIMSKLEEARKLRLQMLEEKRGEPAGKARKRDRYKEFEDFWARNRKAYGADRSLANVLWAHLKAVGCDEPGKFEEGIKHFGLSKGDK